MSLYGAAINGAFGMATTALNNKYAEKREMIARQENYKYGEMAADAADRRTRNLYNDFYSPQAQLNQMREAGLAPSLLASEGAGASGAGQAGAQGTGASGISPNIYGLDPMMLANVEVAKAQARNLNAEADEKEGKNPLGTAKISELLANAGAKDAAKALNEAQKAGIDIDNYIKENTKEFSIRYLQYKAEEQENLTKKAGYEAEREGLAWSFDKETYNTRIQEQTEKLNNIIKDTALKLNNIKLNNEQIELIQAKVKSVLANIGFRAEEVSTQHANWRTYDELVVNEISKMWRDTDIQHEANEIKEFGIYMDLISTIIGSAAHVAGLQK